MTTKSALGTCGESILNGANAMQTCENYVKRADMLEEA